MKDETTGERTRELRNWLASVPHSQYIAPGLQSKTPANPTGAPEICAIILAALDHIHHLEARIAVLERQGATAKP